MAEVKSRQEAQAQEAAKAYDPWNDMVEVLIPMRSRTEQPTAYISINRRGFFVPKGKRTMVPRPVAEVIQRSMEMQTELEKEARVDFGGSVTVAQSGILDEGKLFR
nr:MAG TPA: hypothetical protein [Caudoviricetes sp.]